MKLSVIIVNYNVRHFLQSCLYSAQAAMKGIDGEIIVIDNASTDGSREMMAEKFPKVKYDFLTENIGFSKGNNVGIRMAKGELVLLLNPDTLVAEDSFRKTIAHFDNASNVGGLGVKMIDGSGAFLPESKRGLPTPEAAFYKMTGLSTLFPKSKRFGKYHIAYLDRNENHDVEILSGAYMMMRRSVLDKIGLLDEDFFMYGEDIDLSYRIVKAGYVNRYCADTMIVHYKGESTKKDSVNYVFVFYRAMVIFANKHFEKGRASLFGNVINAAIYLRAGIALFNRLIGRWWQLILDFLIIYSVFFASSHFYEVLQEKNFSEPFIGYLLPLYALILSVVLAYSGAHDKPFKYIRLFRGWGIGILLLLALYALLPEGYRFSRAVVLIGSTGALSAGIIWRAILNQLKPGALHGSISQHERRLVVSDSSGFNKVNGILQAMGVKSNFINRLDCAENTVPSSPLGNTNSLWASQKEFNVSEIIVDPSSCSYKSTIEIIEQTNKKSAEVKVFADNFIVGPNLIYKAHKFLFGNRLYSFDAMNFIRLKRSFDLIFSFFILPTIPICVWFVDQKLNFISNILKVIVGTKSWVGYDVRGYHSSLPSIVPGVISPNQNVIWAEGSLEQAFDGNINYLQSTPFVNDLILVFQHFENLGD